MTKSNRDKDERQYLIGEPKDNERYLQETLETYDRSLGKVLITT